jgi:cell division protein FtsB
VKNNPLQDLLRSVPAPLRNKYILVLTLFFAWMIFIDKHDVLTQFKLQRTVKKLEQEKVLYSEQIKAAERERLDLEVNKEKIAREKYFMKKPGEDVFIIVDEEDQ